MFTLKDIKGAVVEHRQHKFVCVEYGCRCNADGYNQAIDAQSSVKLRFCREKLAELLFKTCDKSQDGPTQFTWKNIGMMWQSRYRNWADVIIAADKDIVEVETL